MTSKLSFCFANMYWSVWSAILPFQGQTVQTSGLVFRLNLISVHQGKAPYCVHIQTVENCLHPYKNV